MNKGKISIGVEGDLVLVDINKCLKVNPEEFASKGRNTPFTGMEFYGEILMTIKGGEIKYTHMKCARSAIGNISH
jgi:dihydroorotase (EC 3.5.2.3)